MILDNIILNNVILGLVCNCNCNDFWSLALAFDPLTTILVVCTLGFASHALYKAFTKRKPDPEGKPIPMSPFWRVRERQKREQREEESKNKQNEGNSSNRSTSTHSDAENKREGEEKSTREASLPPTTTSVRFPTVDCYRGGSNLDNTWTLHKCTMPQGKNGTSPRGKQPVLY